MMILQETIIAKLLAPTEKPAGKLRWSIFAVHLNVADGCLVWNTLTCSLILLEGVTAEYAKANPNELADKDELYQKSFLVDEKLNEHERYQQLKTVIDLTRKPAEGSGVYTIFTTTACNARCPYCFEKGVAASTMTEQIALDAADFIIKTKQLDKVHLDWFGGEPLVNTRAIDVICNKLKENNIDFYSTMTSNGYLFDDALVDKAVNAWNLKRVQITLDGTEETYNKTKAYVNVTDSAYKRVLGNIDALAKAGIEVRIRLNVSNENADDLLVLADELALRYRGNEGVSAYARLLFEYDNIETAPLETYKQLIAKLYSAGLYKRSLPRALQKNCCTADDDNAYCILPTGKLSKCEHCFDHNFVGDIYHGVTEAEIVAKIKERERHERCRECTFAPSCRLLKICHLHCHDLHLATQRIVLEYAMKSVYDRWKEQNDETQG